MLLDGAISTEIEKRGVPMDKLAVVGAWEQDWQRDPARSAQRLHPCGGRRDYNKHVLLGETQPEGCGPRQGEATREINAMAVSLAKQAVDEASEGRTVLVAGIDITVRGLQRDNWGTSRHRSTSSRESYREQAEILAEEGVDLFLLEMLRDVERASVIVEAALATGMPGVVGLEQRW